MTTLAKEIVMDIFDEAYSRCRNAGVKNILAEVFGDLLA